MAQAGDGSARTPPIGTQQRIRMRAIWAVALFASSVPPAFVGLRLVAAGSQETIDVAPPIALVFWLAGLAMALWAALPTLRYWEGLPPEIRWMGALPLLSISLLLSLALIASIL